jgi:hypothetical protein
MTAALLRPSEPEPAGAPQDEIDRAMADRGWMRFPGAIAADRLPAMRDDADRLYELRRRVQQRNGVAEGMEGTAHHVLGEGSSLDDFVNHLPLYDQVEHWFGGKVILLNAGATLHPPFGRPYTLKPHRDVRAWSQGYRLSLNMLVMLDDFTVQNGATLLMSGSHRGPDMPSHAAFSRSAEPLTGRAGDVVLFDSLLVHAAAANLSPAPRRALTLCFGRPFMKPQMDWPRFLDDAAQAQLTDRGRQLLGFHARVPASLDEYYQPPERWAFKPDQR